ncbi:pollen-specific leucine-rich repeat extensin-like protein 3 [Iris pallida]|uniref:Pollen-specific leucine-rich repeat extensin-like protein 3 n=1 Tax=Iris pallida TaxID=29817 RepID=A0AAX6I8Q6_IRIPA|nr:pollen-specific leucine-rich repeat extensin-like protein 3 [Iris pallida]
MPLMVEEGGSWETHGGARQTRGRRRRPVRRVCRDAHGGPAVSGDPSGGARDAWDRLRWLARPYMDGVEGIESTLARWRVLENAAESAMCGGFERGSRRSRPCAAGSSAARGGVGHVRRVRARLAAESAMCGGFERGSRRRLELYVFLVSESCPEVGPGLLGVL